MVKLYMSAIIQVEIKIYVPLQCNLILALKNRECSEQCVKERGRGKAMKIAGQSDS